VWKAQAHWQKVWLKRAQWLLVGVVLVFSICRTAWSVKEYSSEVKMAYCALIASVIAAFEKGLGMIWSIIRTFWMCVPFTSTTEQTSSAHVVVHLNTI
jgi:hypothetical protein